MLSGEKQKGTNVCLQKARVRLEKLFLSASLEKKTMKVLLSLILKKSLS